MYPTELFRKITESLPVIFERNIIISPFRLMVRRYVNLLTELKKPDMSYYHKNLLEMQLSPRAITWSGIFHIWQIIEHISNSMSISYIVFVLQSKMAAWINSSIISIITQYCSYRPVISIPYHIPYHILCLASIIDILSFILNS